MSGRQCMVMKGTVEARPATPDEPAEVASRQNLADSRLGHTIGGRLTLERVLGIGGTATVYAARHRNGRALAVKILHPEFSYHADIRKRFLAEGYAANKVDHPDVVAILDDGEGEDGSAFLVMELLRGKNLFTRLSEAGPLPSASVVAITLRVLDVLAYAHDRGVVHRDLKPSNIFETDQGAVKLLDFGAARVPDGDAAFLTRPGSTLGTPAFMAPELAAGRLEELDALTDLWALGATMFQLLSQQVVHVSRNDNELIVMAATEPARSLGTVRPELEPALVSVVDRALAFDKRDRFPNARAMSRALVEAGRSAGFPSYLPAARVEAEQFSTAPEMALPAARPAPSRSFTRGAWAGLALLLAIAGTVLATRYRVRTDVQAKSDEAVSPPSAVRSTAAASNPLPGLLASAPPEPRPTPALAKHVESVVPRSSASKRAAPSPTTALEQPSPTAKSPLFFPGK